MPATAWGIVGGVLLVAHMALEEFGSRVGENAALTLAFMLTTFSIWGIAGYQGTYSSKRLTTGTIAGCWCATLSVLAAVSFGFAQMFSAVPPLAYVATWEEFKRSGWSDVRAFSIANSLDAGFTHLLAGFVAGSLTGSLGGVVARWRRSLASG